MNLNIHKHGDGYPLVFFHGWGFDSQVWSSLVPRFRMDYQLILVDLPGFGHSSMMQWDLFKDILVNQLPEKFALIGWSMGGLYATRFALENAERVQYLINVNSSPRFLLDDLWPGISQKVFKSFYTKLSCDPHVTLQEFLELQGLSKSEKQDYLPDKNPSLDGLNAGLKVLQAWDLREELKRIKNPSCFMFGRLDPIVPVKTMKFMQLAYPNFKYVLFNRAAHIPFLSHTDLFTQEIREFII